MTEQNRDHCIYCGGEVFFDLKQKNLFKCPMCGSTLVITDFENELTRIHKAIEEGNQAKEALQSALKEKADMQERVNHMISSISSIRKLEDGQESIFSLLNELAGVQDHDDRKLDILQYDIELLLKSRNDIKDIQKTQNIILNQLQESGIETERCNELIQILIAWCSTSHAEDCTHLEKLNETAIHLLEDQRNIDQKVDSIQLSVHAAHETLNDFRNQYSLDKLEEIQHLYHQAEQFQADREFDRAENCYRQILIKGGRDAEIYWRILLCHYCVTYQKDDDGSYIPIILNPDLTSPEEMSIRKDLSRITKLNGKDPHKEELAAIDRILEKYRMIAGNQKYDVFISVKQRQNKRYTYDSDIASDLYDFLTEKGLKVFNSRRSRIPAGQEYEPYIIAALMSAKAMIVVGSSTENMSSQWVKNEWSRFQWIQKNESRLQGKTSRLLICYLTGEMTPYDIPRSLNPNRQAVTDGLHAQDELLAALKSIISDNRKEIGPIAQPAPIPSPEPETGNGTGSGRRKLVPAIILLALALAIGSGAGYGLYRYLAQKTSQDQQAENSEEKKEVFTATESERKSPIETEKESECLESERMESERVESERLESERLEVEKYLSLPELVTAGFWPTSNHLQGLDWNTDTMDTVYFDYAKQVTAYSTDGTLKDSLSTEDGFFCGNDYYDGKLYAVWRRNPYCDHGIYILNAEDFSDNKFVRLPDVEEMLQKNREDNPGVTVYASIDGVVVAPAFSGGYGTKLYVSYGAWIEESNGKESILPMQPILEYNLETFGNSGKAYAERILYADLGVIKYCIQQLEYDRDTGLIWCPVRKADQYSLFLLNPDKVNKNGIIGLETVNGASAWDYDAAGDGITSLGHQIFYVMNAVYDTENHTSAGRAFKTNMWNDVLGTDVLPQP